MDLHRLLFSFCKAVISFYDSDWVFLQNRLSFSNWLLASKQVLYFNSNCLLSSSREVSLCTNCLILVPYSTCFSTFCCVRLVKTVSYRSIRCFLFSSVSFSWFMCLCLCVYLFL